jgi:hypothetical protein
MAWASRVSALGVALGTALLAQACAQPPGRSEANAGRDCQRRVIVSFKLAADAATVAALAADAGVRLAVVSRLMPDIYVLDLSAEGQDSVCDAGLARVRADARVRAADPDRRRIAH